MMFFFCTGYVPLDQYPDRIQPVVQHQPMSYAIAVMQDSRVAVLCFRPSSGPWDGQRRRSRLCARVAAGYHRKPSMR